MMVMITMVYIRDYEDEGPLSLPVTDRELQRQADGQILRSVKIKYCDLW